MLVPRVYNYNHTTIWLSTHQEEGIRNEILLTYPVEDSVCHPVAAEKKVGEIHWHMTEGRRTIFEIEN